MLIVVDFDGTITERDTLVDIVQEQAPEVFEQVEEDLQAGRITLRECIAREFEAVRGAHDEIVERAVSRVRVRPGFADLVASAQAAGHRVVVVSSGFESIITPVLEREGVQPVHVVAHDVRFAPDGSAVEFRHGVVCTVCDQECKRSVVDELRGDAPVVYVGDGYSDRCAALASERIFARDGLAEWLDSEGIAFEPFGDLRDVLAALAT
jgi:2-hydroxy-3-keto-5-methylthiopentenyl-1-phosphate phosphatase